MHLPGGSSSIHRCSSTSSIGQPIPKAVEVQHSPDMSCLDHSMCTFPNCCRSSVLSMRSVQSVHPRLFVNPPPTKVVKPSEYNPAAEARYILLPMQLPFQISKTGRGPGLETFNSTPNYQRLDTRRRWIRCTDCAGALHSLKPM